MTEHEFSSFPSAALLSPGWARCEERIKSFEDAWQRGEAPRIEDYLTGAAAERRALLVELVHADIEFRLKSGQPHDVESYFAAHPEIAADAEAIRDLVHADYRLRIRFRLAVDAADYQRRFPRIDLDLSPHVTLAAGDTRGPSVAAIGPIPVPEIPGYEIIREIGRGGMGVVYRARDQKLSRHVAIKFLPPEFTRDVNRLQRFLREARTASSLNHPHICTIHALGEHEGRPYIVMEFIDGHTLKAVADRKPELDEILRIFAQAARALAAAHEAGVVHRDIKPENIMVRDDGYVKVLDFGLARQLPAVIDTIEPPENDTKPGALLGTIAYMSPEQADGVAIDGASDVFSLGIVLYELVTGQHPFAAQSPVKMLQGIVSQEPIPAARINSSVPSNLDGLLSSMLQKDHRLRATAAEIAAALTLAGGERALAFNESRLRPVVHREPELAALRLAFANADAGNCSLFCLAGEPGIGKTTLVEDFLSELSDAKAACHIARGQCSERLTNAEAYLPVIHALENLVRADSVGSVARLVKVVAPTWAARLSTATADSGAPEALAESQAQSRQAMLREFCNLLRDVSRLAPAVLFFDDVHWADVPTIDLLDFLCHHGQGLRVLLIATYRPTELLLEPHPFHRVKLELQAKGHCTDLTLGFLERADIASYLAAVFPDNALPADFAEAIHSRTEGNPLFMADLLAYLRERGVIAPADGQWRLVQNLPELASQLPQSVRSMIQRKLERLDDHDRRLLSAAAVQGYEFDSAVVAGALALESAEVEERLQELDRVHGLVRLKREMELPDRALNLRYVFVHILYQQTLYDGLPPSRRASLAAALAQRLEQHHGDGASSLAAELACLYEVGRDFARAARQYLLASQNAGRVFAHHEGVALAQRGLQLLQSVPPSADRDELELALQTTLGLQHQVTKGYAAPEAFQAYSRARELSRPISGTKTEFPVLWGLWLYHKVRSNLAPAHDMAQDLLTLARRCGDPNLALQAHQALGITAFCRGRQAAALWNVEQVAALYDPERHRAHSSLFGQDPGVICKSYGAVVLWLLGFPDSAVQQSEAAIVMSRDRSPTSQALALHFAAMVYQLRRDPKRTLRFSEKAGAIAVEHRLSFWLAGASILRGWALAKCGAAVEGLAQLRQGLAGWCATGAVTYETYYLGLLAEVLAEQGHRDEAMQVLEDSLKLAAKTGEGLYLPELHRLHGELLLDRIGKLPQSKQAEAAFDRALDIAREQETKSLALRAAMSLARCHPRLEDFDDCRRLLRHVYDSFTQGFDSPDHRNARVLLQQ
jgi:predicted ATPase/tRNA A-37 threonylcarbamoyl transferase component Bud32